LTSNICFATRQFGSNEPIHQPVSLMYGWNLRGSILMCRSLLGRIKLNWYNDHEKSTISTVCILLYLDNSHEFV